MKKGEILKKEEGLSIVRLRGSPYEIGYQHGRIFKEEINWLRASALKSLCEQEGKIIGRLAFPLSCLMAKRMGKFIPQKFREEFNGIADGAKVDYNFLLLANFVEEISSMHHHHLRHLKIFSSSGKKCSCFVIKGKDGIILGRNLDYPLLTESLPSLNVLFVFLPQQGNPFLSLAWPGMVGVVTGISKKLNLILLSSAAKNWTWKGIPEEILARQSNPRRKRFARS